MATVTIKSGDTLSKIAKANNTTVDAIMKANPSITDPNKIYAGSTLTVPATSTTVTPVTFPVTVFTVKSTPLF